MRTFVKLGLIVATASLASACGDTTGSPPTAESPPAIADEGEEGISEPPLTEAKVGTPFPYQQTFSNTTEVVDWQVTVDKVNCGLRALKGAADNPKWQGGDEVPQTIDATPAAGKEFCQLDATMKNAGKTPTDSAEGFGNIVTDQGEFKSSYEEEVTYSNNLKEAAKAPTGPYNPGDTAKAVQVWSIPAGARPIAVLFPDSTVYGGPTHRITLE